MTTTVNEVITTGGNGTNGGASPAPTTTKNGSGGSPGKSQVVEAVEKRLREAQERRDSLLKNIKNNQGELKSLIAAIPARPREKKAELHEKIVSLERDRTINSIPLQEERKILWEIQRVEKMIRQVEAYEIHDEKIKAKKAIISEMSQSLDKARAEVEALYAELSVTRAAERVGCSKEELVGTKLECPVEKLGNVIGKKGSNVKQIQQSASVTVNVSKGGDVKIMGSPESITAASHDISRVISMTEEFVDVAPEVILYLSANNVTALDRLRNKHPNVNISVQRKATNIAIRGTPTDIDAVTKDVQALQVVKKEFDLPVNEAVSIVGKQGATVEAMQSNHQVAIDVEKQTDNTSHVTVAGPEDGVEAVVEEIEKLASEVRETTHMIPINPNVRAVLLNESGAAIKEIHKRVLATLDGGSCNMNLKDNNVLLTGQARYISLAVPETEKEMKQIESTIVTLETDPVVVPVIIGKGGEQIKKLRGNRNVNIEVEKTGKITLCGVDTTQVTEVEIEINDLILKNQVLRVNVDALFYKSHVQEIIRARSKTLNGLCNLSFDDERCDFVFRGEGEKVKEAETIVKEFLENNFKEEVSVTVDDLRTLLTGGKDCKMEEIANQHEVKLHSNRDRGVIEAKGKSEKVKDAIKALHQFLFGGEGFGVAKISLGDELLGLVIGKGGKRKAELQKKYENVSIAVNGKENTITLRGPEKLVDECRAEIQKVVATARVTGKIELTKAMHDKLVKNNRARDLIHGIPVQLNITEKEITVRGYSADVKDALAVLNEPIKGKYESRLILESKDFQKVKDTCARSSVHLDRVMKASGASIVMDSSDEAVVLRGSRSEVKTAKMELIKLLEFILHSSFAKIQIPAPLMPTVADVPSVAEMTAASGATMVLDRDIECLLLFASEANKVEDASKLIQKKIDDAKALCFEFQLGPDEDWVVSSIIGKRGSHVNSLRKSTKCHIDVDSKSHKVTLTSDDAITLAKGREAIETFVDKCRRECAMIKLPEKDVPAFIGRGGSGISDFAKKHGVDVQALKNNHGTVRITGEESKVSAARTDLEEWMRKREDSRLQSHSFDLLEVKRGQIRLLLADKAAILRSVQDEFNCRVDIDKEKNLVSVRAGNTENRKAAISKMEKLLEEGYSPEDAASGDEGTPKRKSPAKSPTASTKKVSPKKVAEPPKASDFPALGSSRQAPKAASTNGSWAAALATNESSNEGNIGEEHNATSIAAQGAIIV